jgi:hypothetical protein
MQYKHGHEGAEHSADETKINAIIAQIQNIRCLFLLTHFEGPMGPFLTKRGYIIYYSDLSKSAVESEPSRGVGVASVHSASTFVVLDFLLGALVSKVFGRSCFFDEVTHERDCRANEPPAQDFWLPRSKSTIDAWELETLVVSAM